MEGDREKDSSYYSLLVQFPKANNIHIFPNHVKPTAKVKLLELSMVKARERVSTVAHVKPELKDTAFLVRANVPFWDALLPGALC